MAPLLRKFIFANWFFEHRRRRVGPQADLRWDPRVAAQQTVALIHVFGPQEPLMPELTQSASYSASSSLYSCSHKGGLDLYLILILTYDRSLK